MNLEVLICKRPYSECDPKTNPGVAPPREWEPLYKATDVEIADDMVDRFIGRFATLINAVPRRGVGGVDGHVYLIDVTPGRGMRRPVFYQSFIGWAKTAIKTFLEDVQVDLPALDAASEPKPDPEVPEPEEDEGDDETAEEDEPTEDG